MHPVRRARRPGEPEPGHGRIERPPAQFVRDLSCDRRFEGRRLLSPRPLMLIEMRRAGDLPGALRLRALGNEPQRFPEMLRSWSPKTNHDGSCLHSGASVGRPWASAASVTGGWVSAMSSASASDPSATNCWWKASGRMRNSLPRSLPGRPRERRQGCCRESNRQLERGLALLGGECGTMDETHERIVVRSRLRDDHAAVRSGRRR
jgi:hypothetical protein